MNQLCSATITFTVEFLKLFLVTDVFLKIHQKKSVYPSLVAVLSIVLLVSKAFDISQFGLFHTVLLIGLLIANAYEKKKAGIIILSYIWISIIDMIFAVACIVIFRLDIDCVENNPFWNIGLNMFSFILILLAAFIFIKKKTGFEKIRIQKYFSIYLMGGMALSLYLTAMQFMGMEEDVSTYREVLVLGLGLSSLILIVICVLLIINSNQNEYLRHEAEMNSSLLEAQKEYYMMLLQKENETRAFRHDIRKHIFCMNSLFVNGKYGELGEYLADMDKEVTDLSPEIQTGNGLITAIVNDISKKFPRVHLQWKGMLTETLKISSLDICTIFYNLLINAFEAAEKIEDGNVEVIIKFIEATMVITISNSTIKEPQKINGEFVTDKAGDGHGYGIRNVRKCIEKNGGFYSAVCDKGRFVTEIVLTHVA